MGSYCKKKYRKQQQQQKQIIKTALILYEKQMKSVKIGVKQIDKKLKKIKKKIDR